MTTTMPQRRSGFTLIELLVVIAIIGVLIGLTVAAVQQVRKRGKDTEVIEEIQQLTAACTKFKQDNGFNVPDEFTFPSTANTSDENYVLLTRMFRSFRHNPGDALTFTFRGTNVTGQTIRGSQCLVYFLGGPELTGFAITGPAAPAPNAKPGKGPYYEFKVSRLDVGGSTDRFSYRDPYGTPYAFFSAGSSDRYDPRPTNPLVIGGDQIRPYGMTPNNAASTTIKWVNPGMVQIISAGSDKRFGPGLIYNAGPPPTYIGWQPGVPPYIAGGGNFGFDDLANFNSSLRLGVAGGN